MNPFDFACSMFAGGWSTSDREELVEEFGFTNDELDQIFPFLLEMEVSEDGE